MIIDACLFHNEYDVIEIRLKYLYDYVDKFVIVEAGTTHTGQKKSLNFFNNKDRFKWAMDKIIYHPVEIDVTGLDFNYKPKEFEPDAPQWKVENQQRNAILEACKNFSDDDILMISDCDEIPSRSVVDFRKKNIVQHPFACDQRIVAFYLNYTRNDIGWRGTIISDIGRVREYTPQGLRNLRTRLSPFPHGGWHFSYFGGAEQVKRKIECMAHQELRQPEHSDVDYIRGLIESGKGVFDDGGVLSKVNESFYPNEMLKLFPENWWLK